MQAFYCKRISSDISGCLILSTFNFTDLVDNLNYLLIIRHGPCNLRYLFAKAVPNSPRTPLYETNNLFWRELGGETSTLYKRLTKSDF